jgi:hypothetical protein
MNRAALDRLHAEVENALGDDGGARVALALLEKEAAGNPSAAALVRNCEWIAGQPRTVLERLSAISELLSLLRSVRDRGSSGVVQINAREFCRDWCGWRDA